MREIKFRAWDVKEKLWIAGFSIEQSGTLSEVGNKVFMQFTGLKDKNGKEIYEGDIVKDRLGNINVVEYGLVNKKSHADSEIGMAPGFIISYQPYDEEENNEVIGNIYENPDLNKP